MILIIMGSKTTNKRNLNEMMMLTELARLNVIDLSNQKKYSNLIHVSEILFEFIQKRKISSVKMFFEIFIKIIEIIQIILEKRKKYELKMILINFDKFLYDKERNIILYDDIPSLMKNYDFNFFLTDHFVKGKGENFARNSSHSSYSRYSRYSIQPYIYKEEADDYLKEMKKSGKDSDFEFYFIKTGNFYSNLILNFFKNIFHKTLPANSNDSNLIENIYHDFRKEIIIKFKEFYKIDKNLNLFKIKQILNRISTENIFLKEIVSYYEFFGKKSSDRGDSEYTDDSKMKSKEMTLGLKVRNTQEGLLRNKFNISYYKDEKEFMKNSNLTIVYPRRF